MKYRLLKLLVIGVLTGSMSIVAVGCGQGTQSESSTDVSDEGAQEEAVESVAEIDYANINFDYADEIAKMKKEVQVVPSAADIKLSVTDANQTTGLELVSSLDDKNTTDYYLNASLAEDELVFEGDIKSAKSSTAGELEVKDGSVSYDPENLNISKLKDEVITFTMESGEEYDVHTLPEEFPELSATGDGVSEADQGVYTFAVDKFLIRLNTEGEIVYYRNVNCAGEHQIENFAPQTVGDKQYYSVFVELNPDYRNCQGGFSSGYYLVMDENYNDVEEITLSANEDENHTHGEGYLDQHEFVMLGEDHYLKLSYTKLLVDNLPDGVEGLDGGNTAYVWAGIMQEVKDGKVIQEINTADYPLLYESAVEKIDYANSTDEGVNCTVGENEVFSLADGIMDYVHVNSMDYTLSDDGTVDKLLVSMRDQSAVYQFDMASGAMEWILGGKASTLSGYDDYTRTRTDDNGTEFEALTFGQHFAKYVNKSEDGTIDGNAVVSVFDNETGSAPFITAAEVPTLTRVFKATIDTGAKTAEISDVIDGTALNEQSDKYHIASHCGSVQYTSNTSVMIGWGLHGVIDNIGAMAPEGTISDKGYDDLRIGSRPIFTDYNLEDGSISYEVSGIRNANEENSEAFFSYRSYKSEQ
ncbi:MAG: aryl-sulfate sulfotransferase [Eubacterium sp.]|nr:aryl-sulfate sulfotransferase [Eubacterium sp.]